MYTYTKQDLLKQKISRKKHNFLIQGVKFKRDPIVKLGCTQLFYCFEIHKFV